MTNDHYILNPDHSVRKVSILEWARWFEKGDRILKQEDVGPSHEAGVAYWVSTVFLGLDHNYSMEGPPLLFETMIFGDTKKVKLPGREREFREDLYMDRYSTYEEAMAGHAVAVYQAQEWVKEKTL